MNEYYSKAKEKLDAEYKSGSFDRYASAMKKAVRETLETFCEQEEEFAQAVVQGGTFEDCMKKVAKGCGSSLSDLEAYRRAVQFYFPGAEIRWTMTVDLIGAAAGKDDESSEAPSAVLLDFTQFL